MKVRRFIKDKPAIALAAHKNAYPLLFVMTHSEPIKLGRIHSIFLRPWPNNAWLFNPGELAFILKGVTKFDGWDSTTQGHSMTWHIQTHISGAGFQIVGFLTNLDIGRRTTLTIRLRDRPTIMKGESYYEYPSLLQGQAND